MTQLPELPDISSANKKEQPQKTFGSMLSEALEDVNDLQVSADKMTQQYLAGENTDIAAVLLATEKANLALQLTVQIRNKIVEAYQDIANMQI
jgi:flagellar hook-basal body complex protein FliE